MKIYTSIFACVLAIFSSCKGQNTPKQKTVYNDEFKWTILIPSGFDTVSAQSAEKLQTRGENTIEKTFDIEVENKAKTIFLFKNDEFNYFESNYQPFDETKYNNYFESFKQVNDIVYGTFEVQAPDAILDSSYSTQVISGLTFHAFKLTLTIPQKIVITWQMFSRLFDTREFTVNIMTVDKVKETILLNSWLQSKFE